MAQAEVSGGRNKRLSRRIGIGVFAFLATAAIAYYIYSMTCPCERTPGGILFGERIDQPVDDWRMVNEVENCELQIAAGIRPHSLTLNCWSTPEGVLYVGCMSCETKYWGYQVGPDERGYFRVAGRVYPVTINRIEDEGEVDRIWRSRFFKLNQRSVDPVPETPRVDGWWAFSVVSRSS